MGPNHPTFEEMKIIIKENFPKKKVFYVPSSTSNKGFRLIETHGSVYTCLACSSNGKPKKVERGFLVQTNQQVLWSNILFCIFHGKLNFYLMVNPKAFMVKTPKVEKSKVKTSKLKISKVKTS